MLTKCYALCVRGGANFINLNRCFSTFTACLHILYPTFEACRVITTTPISEYFCLYRYRSVFVIYIDRVFCEGVTNFWPHFLRTRKTIGFKITILCLYVYVITNVEQLTDFHEIWR